MKKRKKFGVNKHGFRDVDIKSFERVAGIDTEENKERPQGNRLSRGEFMPMNRLTEYLSRVTTTFVGCTLVKDSEDGKTKEFLLIHEKDKTDWRLFGGGKLRYSIGDAPANLEDQIKEVLIKEGSEEARVVIEKKDIVPLGFIAQPDRKIDKGIHIKLFFFVKEWKGKVPSCNFEGAEEIDSLRFFSLKEENSYELPDDITPAHKEAIKHLRGIVFQK